VDEREGMMVKYSYEGLEKITKLESWEDAITIKVNQIIDAVNKLIIIQEDALKRRR
jgi:hypothetical protein